MGLFYQRSRSAILFTVSILVTLSLYLSRSLQVDQGLPPVVLSDASSQLDIIVDTLPPAEVSSSSQRLQTTTTAATAATAATASAEPSIPGVFSRPEYVPGTIDVNGQQFTRTLVIARTSEEDVGWIDENLHQEAFFRTAIHTVDQPAGNHAVPLNKGHEVMAYLTYIIDHYDQLSNVTMFMHAHQITWHNNDLLDSDAAKMVKHLSSARVIREGYMNMRCHWEPGCPAHIRPLTAEEDNNVPEAVIIGRAWTELFPGQRVPEVLSQPCCAQLALSRDRIHALPKEQYSFLRDWLLNTELEDRITGRIFEYVWQYLWTGEYEFCPKEHICYCDGYGICFGGEQEYTSYFALRQNSRELREEITKLRENPGDDRDQSYADSLVNTADELDQKLSDTKDRAFERGRDPRNRAQEAGRPWYEGDGF